MVDMSKFKLDNLKKMGSSLVDSVSSSDVVGKIKSSIGSKGSLEVLPENLQVRITTIDKKIEDITILQKTLNDAITALKQEAAGLSKDAIAMYQPKQELKVSPPPPKSDEK